MKKNLCFIYLFTIVLIARLLLVYDVSAKTLPTGGEAKPDDLKIYLPWESGKSAFMTSGYSYNEAGSAHTNVYASYYAFDFNLVEEGGDIYPVAPGNVIFAGNKSGWGNTVIIQHDIGDGKFYYSQYSHLQSPIDVAFQQEIHFHDVIGQEGTTTKGSTGIHLHFLLSRCDIDIMNSDGSWPIEFFNISFCHPLVPEPFIGQHVYEGLGWWDRLHENDGSTARAFRPDEYGSDKTAPSGYWGDDAPEDLEEVNINDPIIFDMYYSDNVEKNVSEIRATMYYANWSERQLQDFDPSMVWRILARCDPRETGASCQSGHWRFEWIPSKDKGFPVVDNGLLGVPWMPKARLINGNTDICISFDVFDEAGNAMYAPPGGATCSFKNSIQDINSEDNNTRRIRIVSTTQENSGASFVSDLTLPDGTVVSSGQSLTKTWRLRNSGTSTWGSGYKLVFVSGEQMGAPQETDVPSTAPNQVVDLSIPLTAPATTGEHTGYFQLRNPQGTYFGPRIWVKINVRAASNKITILSVDPASPADTGTVRISVRVDGLNNFRAMRLKVDGQVQGEHAGPEHVFSWNTSGFAAGAHSIVIEATDFSDPNWSRPEVRSSTYTLLGTGATPNLRPEKPTLSSPYNWSVYYSGNTANLCAQANGDPDGDAITGYYFDVYESAQIWNSGWTGNDCVTTAALGPYNYKWHVKVRDARGAESDWSTDWNFTLVNPSLSITNLSFTPMDGNSEVVRINACTAGQGGIGITMRVDVNDANDGSANGQWHRIKELGVPCFSDSDAPLWQTLEAGGNYGDGPHLVRVEAHGLNTGWDGAAVREAVYTLPHRRPAAFNLIAPVSPTGNIHDPIFLNTRTITFSWQPSLRATGYILSVGTGTNPAGDSNPMVRQTLDGSTTQQTVTFTGDFPALYWQVRATNDMGSTDTGDQLFGIDQNLPTCIIQSLPAVSYENNFQVNWSGSDSPSGIRSYDIQYLDTTRGEWNDWLTAVPSSKTYELFMGQAGHSYSFRCRSTDQANNVGAFPTSGDGTILIDPTARPLEPWWGTGYASKRNITIQNNMTAVSLPVGYPVSILFTSGTTPTAAQLYAASLSPNKCDDLRVVYNNTSEVQRFIRKCAPDEIEIWFRSQIIVAGGSTSNAHQLYYGNPSPGAVLGDLNQVLYPYLQSGTTNLYFFQEGTGSTTLDSSGNNRTCTLGPSTQWGSGKFGPGIQVFQQSSGGIRALLCATSPILNAFTVDFWYKTNAPYDGRIIGALGGGGNGGPGNNWMIEYRGRMHLEIWANGGSTGVESNFDLRNAAYVNQWNHIAVTFNGANEVKFYINGSLDSTKYLNSSGINTYSLPLEIGAVESGGQVTSNIGALRISNVVRNDFSYGSFASITIEPTARVNDPINPPVVGTPDLVILSLNSYPAPTGGILVEATVTNQGPVSTTNGFYTDLYVNHLPTGAGDYSGSLQFWVNDPIPAGGMVTLTTIIDDPINLGLAPLAPGDEVHGTLFAQTDSTGAITETDNANNINATGTEICVAAGDAYEGADETAAGATLLVGPQIHNFDRPGDSDWMRFTAVQGQLYTLTTSALGSSADTYLYLYDQDGTTLLASNDDYGESLASQIAWVAPASGTYYILVKQWNPSSGGCGTGYTMGNLLTINASAGVNGSIAPSGAILVNYSINQVFTVTPATGYHVVDVMVDGVSVGAVTSYTFDNVIANHTITASFAENAITHSIQLVPGWNLVSFNIHPTSSAITDVLATISGNYSLIYAWDAATSSWLIYDPNMGFGNTLTTLDVNRGFWIRMTTADTLIVSGDLPTTSNPTLQAGWNLVGFPSQSDITLPDALSLNGVGNDPFIIFSYHANDSDPWKIFDSIAPAWANDLPAMSPGWGYWVHVSDLHTWVVSY